MSCPRCRTVNPPEAQFCLECATPLRSRCASCDAPLPPAAKFCIACAHPAGLFPQSATRFGSPDTYTPRHLAEAILGSKAVLEAERKHVTVRFADLKGSMELLADRDPEEARRLLDPVLVPARLGRQDVLQPDATGRASGRERRRVAGGAPRRRSRTRPAQAAPGQAREPVFPRGDGPDIGGDESAGG